MIFDKGNAQEHVHYAIIVEYVIVIAHPIVGWRLKQMRNFTGFPVQFRLFKFSSVLHHAGTRSRKGRAIILRQTLSLKVGWIG